MRDTIYLYYGPGASKESIKHTVYSINKIFPDLSLIKLNHHDLLSSKWVSDARLLIMPGGADRGYCNILNGTGNAIISNYVKTGGSYLGICAGAYYATQYVKFGKGTKLEVIGERELCFIKGTAEGPTLAPYDYHSNSGVRAAQLSLNNTEYFTAFYNGGCHFNLGDNEAHVDILAYYDNHSVFKGCPAIVQTTFGSGKVILSGVHIEYAIELLDKTDQYIQLIIKDLTEYDLQRRIFFTQILSSLITNHK